jgi:outer membrane protein assembly factor BamB
MHRSAVRTSAVIALIAGAAAAAQDAGDLLWRYPVGADFIGNEPTVAADGTIYASDSTGSLYAISPDGSEKWTVDALRGQAGNADEGPVAVFDDGTVLVAANPLGAATELVAFHPDGSFKWVLTFTESISWFAGPNIGPGGLAYAAQSGPTADDQVLAVDSGGNVAWSVRADPDLFEENPIGADIVFARDGSREILAFHCDQNTNGQLFAFDTDDGSQVFNTFVSSVNSPFMQHLQLQPESDYAAGRIYMTAFGWGSAAWGMRAFDTDGSVLWTYDPTIASEATAPAIGPDGTIFVAWDLNYFGAVEPDGTERWQIFDDKPFREQPTPSPDGSFVVGVGGDFGASGRVEAFDAANGQSLWEAPLTLPAAGNAFTSGRAVFAPDASAVYVNSSVFSGGVDGSFIYAFATGSGPDGCNDADLAAPFGVLDLADVQTFIAGFTAQEPIADLDPPAGVWDLADVQAFVSGFNAGCP